MLLVLKLYVACKKSKMKMIVAATAVIMTIMHNTNKGRKAKPKN